MAETNERVRTGMRWIPAGPFLMGSEDFYPEEAPVRQVEVDGFWTDERPVTVPEFRRFVTELGTLAGACHAAASS